MIFSAAQVENEAEGLPRDTYDAASVFNRDAISLLAAPPTFYLRYGMARAGVKLLYSVLIGLLVFEAIALRGNGDGTEGDAA